ncbi:MAG: diadenylate cyclase CdaA [Clostridia bacterium]|nr:diadenylate cyclase CdaA [Clostridia bacterium]
MNVLLLTLSEQIADVIGIIKTISLADIIDIACVSVLLYYLFKFIRERRAGKLAIGIVLLFIIQFVSQLADMYVMQYIMQNIFQVGIITLVILFQQEIRSLLEKVGAQPLKGLKGISGESKVTSSVQTAIDEVVSAVVDFSEDKTGALIVFERTTKLGDIVPSGTVLDAAPTAFLLKNIFFNKAPLHDGALIIRGGRLHAGGCVLPVSNNPDIIKDLGTRHRAGIGVSENSDAVVVIVSEETGTISTAVEGNLERGYTRETLTEFLRSELMSDADRTTRKFTFRTHTKGMKEPIEK